MKIRQFAATPRSPLLRAAGAAFFRPLFGQETLEPTYVVRPIPFWGQKMPRESHQWAYLCDGEGAESRPERIFAKRQKFPRDPDAVHDPDEHPQTRRRDRIGAEGVADDNLMSRMVERYSMFNLRSIPRVQIPDSVKKAAKPRETGAPCQVWIPPKFPQPWNC